MLVVVTKIFDLLSAEEKIRLYLLFAALVCMAGIDMLGIASILPFMAVVSTPGVIHSNRWLHQTYDVLKFPDIHSFLFFLGILVLGLMVFSNAFKALYTWGSLSFDNTLNYMLGRRLLASYLSRPYEFFLNKNTAELGKNVLAEVREVIAGVLSPCMQILSNGLVCLAILALLIAVNPLIALAIAIVLGGAYGAVYFVARNRLLRIGKEQLSANTMKYKAASEALCGIKDLKILGRESIFLERYAGHARIHAQHNATAGVIAQLPRFALEIIAFGGILLIVLCSLGSEEELGAIVPLLSIYAFAGYRLLPAMQQAFAAFSAARVNLPKLDVLHADLCINRCVSDPEQVLGNHHDVHPLPLKCELLLQDVSYCYAAGKEHALKDVNLRILPNTSVGLVGATGSGKTTAVDLILGLLTPTSGMLRVDGVAITGPNLVRWQRNLGYVPQSIYLCDDTITRNIAFGVPDDEIDMESVICAARIANLLSFVEDDLPDGFDTVIGERGVRLSGGQRQRIGIARALYRDPSVLIMDEATSALDGVTEEAVMDALRSLSGEKTVIMIAHRLTTVKDCDVIYLMNDGHIASQGTYQELMTSSSWFQAAARTGN